MIIIYFAKLYESLRKFYMTLIFKNIMCMNLVHFNNKLYPQNNNILYNMMLWKRKMQDLKPYVQDDFSTQKGKRADTEYIIEARFKVEMRVGIFMIISEFLRPYSWQFQWGGRYGRVCLSWWNVSLRLRGHCLSSYLMSLWALSRNTYELLVSI